MKETGKSILRRLHDSRFATRYFVGSGIDIGAGDDGLDLYKSFFPLINSVKHWDLPDGDAQLMAGVEDNCYDFVHSSHCLEHLNNPNQALENWIRICRPGGYLVIMVPDEDLYEQGVFPSTFNQGHLYSFTIKKTHSWNTHSLNLLDLLYVFSEQLEIQKIELLDSSFRYNEPRYDQTDRNIGECAIECILKKK